MSSVFLLEEQFNTVYQYCLANGVDDNSGLVWPSLLSQIRRGSIQARCFYVLGGGIMKKCSKCGQVKSLDEFQKHPGCRGGVHSQCKSCKSIYYRLYKESHYEDLLKKNKASSAQYRKTHRDQRRRICSLWKKKHPEMVRESRRKQRARGYGCSISITPDQWEAIKKIYDYRCIYCGQLPQELTQDHIIPLSRGGSHSMDNVVPACRSCNQKKNKRLPASFEPLQAHIDLLHMELDGARHGKNT